MYLILIVLVILLLVGLPQFGGSFHNMGYAPSGLVGIIVLVVLVLLLSGRL